MSNNRPGLLRTLLSWMWRHKLITAIALVALVLITPTDETTTAVTDAGATATEAVKDAAEEVAEPEQPTATVTETVTQEPTPSPSEAPTEEPTEAAAADGTALAALATLEVKGRAPMTGYDRSFFGQEWSDAAGDFEWSRSGCDTRNDLLARDLQRETVESNGCVVTQGVLAYEPYTGTKNYYFDKHDNEYATDLDGEHIYPLGLAFATGAQQWSEEKRAAFANDPDNLMLANPSLNRARGDADVATWLPPNKAFRCSLVARMIRMKVSYAMWVLAPEKAAMERILAACPDESLDQPDVQAGYTVTAAQAEQAATAAAPAKPTPTSTPTPAPVPAQPSAYYDNCDAVRAAGAAPIRRGDPGYGSHLDRDGDGIACE